MASAGEDENDSKESSSPPAVDPAVSKASSEPPKPCIETAADYSKAVDQWLWQCYYWQSVASGFPYFLASVTQQSAASCSGGVASYFQDPRHGQSTTPATTPTGSREYSIPPLWKRFAAEFIDFFILFLLKLIVTFIAIDFFEIIDLDKYDFDVIREELLDYKLAFEMTSEIIMLEAIHRFVVCFFEALCLHRGTTSQGGATPGKSILGLKVVSCTHIQELHNGRVVIQPADDIGFGWALLRSFFKNFSLAFFFPVYLTILAFQHNRTAYDVLCRCIVVEERSPARTRAD